MTKDRLAISRTLTESERGSPSFIIRLLPRKDATQGEQKLLVDLWVDNFNLSIWTTKNQETLGKILMVSSSLNLGAQRRKNLPEDEIPCGSL